MILELTVTSDVAVLREVEGLYCNYSEGGGQPYPFEQVCFQRREEGSQAFSVSQAVGWQSS